jgi:hypothetical protein
VERVSVKLAMFEKSFGETCLEIKKCRKNNLPKIPSKSNYENISPKTQLQMNS